MSRVIHFDLPAVEPQRAIDFYSKVFGWNITKWDGPIDYWLITTGSDDKPGINGGLYRQVENEVIKNLTIDVDDIDLMTKRVQAHGATIARPKSAIPGIGWIVYFNDTEGNTCGMIQNDPQAQNTE